MSHFVVFPLFALLLAGQRGWQPHRDSASRGIIAILTASRATIGLAGFGFVAVFLLSALRTWTSRKAVVALLGAIALAALTPLALSSLETSICCPAPISEDYDEREALMTAAATMLSDTPMGIGANNL